MTKVLYDLIVKEGEYQDETGMSKARFLNVGKVLQKETQEGTKSFMLLKRSFNPAGIANPENKDSIILSLVKPKPKEAPVHSHPTQAVNQQAAAYHAAKNGTPPTLADINNDNLDDIPF